MTATPNLALPLLAAAQSQKHVTHNEALLAIDALLHCAVLDKDLAAPPGSPAEGARYIVAAAPGGAWAGKAGQIAAWQDGLWIFYPPNPGLVAYLRDEGLLYFHGPSGWAPLGVALGAIQALGRIGIGTTADAANPFAAKLNAALWTAKPAAEGGTGDLRYTLNKEGAADVLSLLFQSGFSGRLELGLIGSDSPAVKVSPDGATWRTALTIDAASGGVDYLSSETALASAATVDLGAVPHRRVAITGSAAVTSFGTARHVERLLRFTGGAALAPSASLILPGGAAITTAPGDTALATSDASGAWTVRAYGRAHGKALVPPAPTDLGTAYIVAESIGSSGYRRWSDGYIEQWGYVSPAGGQGSIAYPVAFPNSLGAVGLFPNNGTTASNIAFAAWSSNAQLATLTTQHRIWNGSAFQADNTGCFWFATGR